MLKHTGIETHEQAKVISYLFKKSVYIQEKIPIANINFSFTLNSIQIWIFFYVPETEGGNITPSKSPRAEGLPSIDYMNMYRLLGRCFRFNFVRKRVCILLEKSQKVYGFAKKSLDHKHLS